MSDLTKTQMDALAEIAKVGAGRLYWWRVASMKKLEDLGLVETWLPPSVAERPRMTGRPWRITDAGRARIRALAASGEADER